MGNKAVPITRQTDELCDFCYSSRKALLEMRATKKVRSNNAEDFNAMSVNFGSFETTLTCICSADIRCRDTLCDWTLSLRQKL